MSERLINNRWIKWSLVFVFWTIIGLSFASQFYLSSNKFGRPVSWSQALSWSLGDWYVWALLSFPILALARRFPLERPRWIPNVLVHFLASALFAFIYIVLRALAGQWQSRMAGEMIGFKEFYDQLLAKTFQFNLLTYWVIVTVGHAFEYYRKFHEREIRNSELEKRLTEARLKALQMQLNPHFLFNTLHAISALMHTDIEAADKMLVRLSDLLRYALNSSESQRVPLAQEISFLRRYLEIEETRFGERLKVKIDLSPETLDLLVPNLVLQPVVENAIRHGLEPHPHPGELRISAQATQGQLTLVVTDNGVGFQPAEAREGVGLSNTRSRLQQLYGAAHSFTLERRPEGGTVATIRFPAQHD